MSNVNARANLEGIIFPNREVARTMRSTCRDLHEVVRVLDSERQSDMAGRLHALTIELRQLASIAELRADVQPAKDAFAMSAQYKQNAGTH